MDMVEVKNLNFSYNGNPVLRNISFGVEKNSFISILGPNGSGKSTLINIISRVLKKYGGNINIDSKDLASLSSREVAKLVAVVPQSTNPGFNFTVREMVAMGRYPYISRLESLKQTDEAAVESVIKKTRLNSFADRRYNELSGGEKQRVIIAQALVQDTPLLLLDEPTSHLDINFQIELMDLFGKLNRDDGKTVIGIFHDINLAIQYSNKALFLKDGTVFDYGNIEDVVTEENIERVFSSEVYVAKNPFTGKLYINPTFNAHPARSKNIKDIRVHVIAGGGAASPVLSMLYSHGYKVSCGVVNNLDTDLDTAQMLGIPFVSEAPFSPISLYAQNRNLEFIKGSDYVVLSSLEFGHGNFSNLVSAKEALEAGKEVVVIEEVPVGKRDHTGGKAAALYDKIIRGGARVVKSKEDVLKIIGGGNR
ncbi:MAG: ABC transporter ATP-binding protein [Actinomycetota bacterium]